MPRDGGGNYTLPGGNPVVSGTTIQASWANDTMTDMAEAMTDSLSRSGQGGMLVPFRLSNGLATAPSLSFTSEPTLGIYRPSAGILGFTSGGGEVARIRASGNMQTAAAAPTTVADFTRKDYVDGVATGLQVDIDQNASDIGDNASAIGVNASDIAALQDIIPTVRQVILASDPAWVPSAGAKVIRVILTAGGGGGGGCDGTGSGGTQPNAGAGGATAIKTIYAPFEASYAIVVGAAGAAGAAAAGDGGAGGDSSFIGGAINLLAGGGAGGLGHAGAATATFREGVSGTVATGGDINIRGGDSESAQVNSGRPSLTATSGSSYWQAGRQNRFEGTARQGVDGCGGGVVSAHNATPNFEGGVGGAGLCVIDEFF